MKQIKKKVCYGITPHSGFGSGKSTLQTGYTQYFVVICIPPCEYKFPYRVLITVLQ
jgi:hypothetical protein